LDLGRQLFTILWEPVAASIEKPVVYVVPHGPLHYLPFSALHDGTTYLLARHPLAVTPSATVLTFLKAKGRRPLSDGVVFGNPVTGGAHVDLPHAEQEAVWVGAALPRATVVTRTEATESRAKDLVSTAGIVHFATHGVLDVERPLESALLLAPDSQNDGRLTAREIFGLRLPGTLVVLSACRTGMSQLAAGDELIGLTRAFMYAGARTIVGTLWDISDESTAHLMREFYARLGTESKAQALRSAQLAVRARYPHPFYWAPFLIIGDWE
jgi:CHAT domain-containing protein